ncbi:MAG: hypothetical protein JWN98_798, partial [Abditibacteriota bacterium]|nr:hypothetical protein [Abditibacteriota bacterium]
MSHSTLPRFLKRTRPLMLPLAMVAGWLGLQSTLSAVHAATVTVSSAADSGPGTLREAIEFANSSTGADTINFIISGADLSIDVLSALPPVTGPTTIDGSMQPGYANAPLIEINGAGAGPDTNGLILRGGGNTVRALCINRFDQSGLRLDTNGGNTVSGCYLGTDLTGTNARGNRFGLLILDSSNNVIGGAGASGRNVISGNRDDGVFVLNPSANNNFIGNNHIGTTADGTAALGNSGDGIQIQAATGNTLGRLAAGGTLQPNVISGNGADGIVVLDGSNSNAIEGNRIVTIASG